MAKLVGAFGTPHGPGLPKDVAQAPGKLPTETLMAQVREQLEAVAPDLIIEVASDHFTNFFYNNFPQFCVGMVDEAEGPAETYCEMPRTVVKGMPEVAMNFLKYGLKSHFDVGVAQELRLDHSVVVPLHFLTPSMEIPVVPLFVNGLVPPLPSAERCLALGRALGQFIEELGGNLRVALLASGAFSLEVGGPRMGYTDEEWMTNVTSLLEQGKYGDLARSATSERMYAAGNISGELLCWITVTGALGEKRPLFVETDGGTGYAAWNLE